MKRVLGTVIAGAALLLASRTFAEDAPSLRDLCPDRPGKGTPPCIVDAGHLQLEVAIVDWQAQRAADVSSNSYDLGSIELRLGLTDTLEAEAAWTAYSHFRNKEDGLVSSGGVIIPMAVSLPDGFSLGVSPQVDGVPNASGHGRHAAYVAAVGLSHPIGPISAGVELWGAIDDDPSGRTTQASLDLMAAFIPKTNANLQLDAGVNLGLTHDTPDVEIAVGVARRF